MRRTRADVLRGLIESPQRIVRAPIVTASSHSYQFGPFRLEPAERRLLRDGETVPLTPKCFDLLVVLVENSGHLLEKSDLLKRVWPDQFVEEGNLSFNISELRKALGGDSQYVETVRKKGFRFVAPVLEITGASETTTEATGRATHFSRTALAVAIIVVAVVGSIALLLLLQRRRTVIPVQASPTTIAVLPFKPLAATMRDEPLEMGICNALIDRLAGVRELIVRPTSSVVAYHKMGQDPIAAGRELGADVVIDGYIEKSSDTVRVSARLLRTVDGKSLWTGEFNQSFTDIFTVEDSISRQIVDALHLEPTRDEARRVTRHQTENIEAYDLYLKGKYFQDKRTREGALKSIEYFQEATIKDTRYAAAFAALSDSWHLLAVRGDVPPKEAFEKARTAAIRGVGADASSAEAHSALANVMFWHDWDWPGAGLEFRRAIELSANDPIPNEQYASYLLAIGRQQEAISEIKRAQRLAPLSLTTNVQAARILFFAGRYDQAIDECRKTIDMDPGFGGAYLFAGRIYAQKGLYREALAALERARVLLHDSAEVLSLLGYAYAVSGRTEEARQRLTELQELSKRRYVSPYHLAMIHAGLGEAEAALQSLEKAYEDREGRLCIVRFAPEFSTVRADPRFAALMQRMKLP